MQFTGHLVFDSIAPEGVLRKKLNDSVIRQIGWQPQITIENGIDKYLQSRLDLKN